MKKCRKGIALILVAAMMMSQTVYGQEISQTTSETAETIEESQLVSEIETDAEEAAEEITETVESEETEAISESPSETDIWETETEDSKLEELVEGDFLYTVSSNEAKITGYTGEDSRVEIPSVIGSYPVTEIGNYAFEGCKSLEELVIPESVKKLGYYIIKDTAISSITIPKSISNVNYNSVSGGSNGPLTGAGSLKEVIFEEGMTWLPSYILASANYTSQVERVLMPDTVTTIGYAAFEDCKKLTEVDLPESLKTIGSYAFDGCTGIKMLTIPSSVRTVGNNAFVDCTGLEKVDFAYEAEDPSVAERDALTVGASAFYGCTYLSEIKLSENVTEIGDGAFESCKSLKELVIPESVKKLGYYIIQDTAIRSITIPKSISNVNYSSVSGGYNGPLTGASSLKEVIFEEGMTWLPSYILASASYTSQVERVVIPDTVTTIGYAAFEYCKKLTEVDLPERLETIGSYAFEGCTGIKEITIPSSAKTISNRAFSNCTGVEKVDFAYEAEDPSVAGRDALTVGASAFYGCTYLSEIKLSENVTEIGDGAFESCKSLKELVIPESVKKLGYYIIQDTAIRSITIPKSISNVNYSSVSGGYNGPLTGASSLKEVIFEEGMTWLPSYILASGSYTSNVEKVLIPGTVTSIGNYAFDNCKKITIYGIPGSYAETYANDNNIPFADISTYQEGLYKTADYTVKVVDDATGHSVSGVQITISDTESKSYYTDDKGIAHITVYGTATQTVAISKEGYESASYSGWPWKSTGVNVIKIKRKQTMEEQIISMTPQISMSGDKLKGPEITILGNTFNLFETDVSFKLPLFDNMVVKQDPSNKTVKVLLGFDGKYSAKLEAADADDTYWSDSYQQVKSLVKGCGGKVDTTKLWNQFSSLRGQLKEINGTAAINVGGSATGFIEFSYVNGGLEIIDSGLVAMLQAGTTVKAPLFWCVYEEFGLSGKVSGQLNFQSSAEKKFIMDGNMGLALVPSLALGVGSSAVFDIKGGVEGTISGKMVFPAQKMRDALSVTMSGKLFMKTSSPVSVLCYSKDWDLGTVELYPEFGAYLEASDWKLAVDDRVVPGEGEAYEYANPQVAVLSDGRKVKVYIDDDGTKTTGNHTTLMYQIYENGAWTDAKAVCETGRADSSPVLYAYGDKAFVAWLNINKEIDTSTSAEYVYANTDLYFAEFNGSAFETPELVPDAGNQKLEFNYAESADANSQIVAWVENSKNDPFMQEGTNTIYVKVRTGNAWGEKKKLLATKDTILNLEVLSDNGQVTVYYSDGSNNYSVVGGTVSDLGEGSNTKIFDCQLYYIENGTLHGGSGKESTDYGIACGSDYQVMDGAVYWTVSSGYTSELYMQKIGASAAVQLTYDKAYVSSFTVSKDSSGNVLIEYVSTAVNPDNASSPYGKSTMKTIADTCVYDLICDSISYDAAAIKPGEEASFNVHIANNSTAAVQNIKLRVKGKNNAVIVNDTVIDNLESGESKDVTFKYVLPDRLEGLTLKAEVYASGVEEADEDNNISSVTFGETDIQIQSADSKKIVVANHGYMSAENVKVSVYEEGSNEAIVEYAIGNLSTGKTMTQTIEIPDQYLKFENYEDIKIFKIQVTTSTEETLLADNEYLLQIEPPHVTGIKLDQAKKTLSKGKKGKLTAELSGSEGADTSVLWNSSDKAIVEVDDKGNITAISEGTAVVTVMTVDGNYSAECEVTVTEKQDTLDKVELVKAVDNGKAQIEVSWKAVEDAEGYRIYRKSAGEDWSLLAEVEADKLSYTDDSGDTGKKYSYTVQAYKNADGKEITGEYNENGVSATKLPATVALKEAKNNEKDGIDISWNKVSNADGYRIYRKTSGSSWSRLSDISSNTKITYTDKTAVSGTTYYYTVRAYKVYEGTTILGGYDNKGVSAAFKESVQPLGKVELSGAKDSGKASIIVSWKAVEGAEGYRIYRKFTGSSWKKLVDVASDQLSYTDSSGVTGKQYTYTIRAFRTVNGKEELGGFDNLGVSATKLPSSVVLKSAKDNGKDGIDISWNKVSNADGYRVYRKTANSSWTKLSDVTSNTTIIYTDKTVASGKAYYYTVRAYKVYEGKTVFGGFDNNGVNAVFKNTTQPLGTVVLNQPKDSGKGSIIVSWKSVEGAEGYRIYRKFTGSGWKKLTDVSSDQLSYVDGSGVTGKQYTYTVRAFRTVNGKEELGGFDSLGVSATKLPVTVVMKSASNNGKGGIDVSWNKVSNATGYRIYRKEEGGSWKGLDTITSYSVTTYTDDSCVSGKTYAYTVRAYKEYEGKTCYGGYDNNGVSVKCQK